MEQLEKAIETLKVLDRNRFAISSKVIKIGSLNLMTPNSI